MSARATLVEARRSRGNSPGTPALHTPSSGVNSMGIKDQFQDKAKQAQQQGKQAMSSKKGQQQERSQQAQQKAQQAPDEAQRAAQEAQDKFDMDYDA
ncbi:MULTISPECIES: hypothetical protein [unclassified Streptomyces]|uniref:Small EDRK-rich factor-like N-terminal domain-containing protein n=1 Tax=Streptomyces sp. NBC_00060 TaxID=2975636 RepID=A0AAU2H4M2_9ACTN